MTAAPGAVNELVSQIMTRMHSEAEQAEVQGDSPHWSELEVRPSLTQMCHATCCMLQTSMGEACEDE